MRYNTKIVYKKPIAAILFSAIIVLSIFSGVALADKVGLPDKGAVLADKLDHSDEIQKDYTLSPVPISREDTSAPGTVEEIAIGKYPTLASFTTIPSTIRVLRSETGEIDEVDFKEYVKNVLPNEWIPSWDMEALKAGAMAAKTYAWYWTIHQKYPGEDYDVRDDTGDQVYKPGTSHPRTDQAVEETWNWYMTKDDNIFQAQYHAGTPGDPDPPEGYEGRMSQWGTQYWAEEGKDWQWMLHYYYAPIALKYLYSLDLIFTIDTTGSMGDDIAYVKASASAIADEILSDIPTARIAVVDYRDFSVYPYGGAGDYPFNDVLAFSTDKPSIVAAIQGLTLGWGADWRESVYSALMHSIDSTSLGGWRGSDQAAKVIILMGDAPPHDPEPFTGYTLSSVVTAAYNADPVIIYPIQIGGTVEKFEELADQTGGEVFTAASAGEVVDAILEAIGEIKTKPVAVANGPYSGYVGSPITFDGTGSYDLDGMIVSYEWDLDDDGEFDDATGPKPSMTWAVPYSGTISLRVTDNDETTDTDSTTLTVEESGDTEPPTIESVTLDAYTTIPDASIHVTVEATDNVGVTSVTADGVALVETGGIWEGDITAPSATGDYLVTIHAEDAAENFDEAVEEYAVVIPTGGLGVAILPKISSAPAGSIVPLDIKIVSTENFDDVLHVYLTLDGIPPDYQADLSWFDWTDMSVQAPAGGEIILPITVDIPGGTSPGYKSFGVKVESTKWSSDAQDYGAISVA